jgi:hypothetical protein
MRRRIGCQAIAVGRTLRLITIPINRLLGEEKKKKKNDKYFAPKGKKR